MYVLIPLIAGAITRKVFDKKNEAQALTDFVAKLKAFVYFRNFIDGGVVIWFSSRDDFRKPTRYCTDYDSSIDPLLTAYFLLLIIQQN